jgi:hypothetical protein
MGFLHPTIVSMMTMMTFGDILVPSLLKPPSDTIRIPCGSASQYEGIITIKNTKHEMETDSGMNTAVERKVRVRHI